MKHKYRAIYEGKYMEFYATSLAEAQKISVNHLQIPLSKWKNLSLMITKVNSNANVVETT